MPLPHEKLAALLMEAGLHEMSLAAREYRYHDFKSPLGFPSTQLVHDLREAMTPKNREKVNAIYQMHMNGDFDATKEESDEWAAGPEGQDAFNRLIRGD
jgi:hypothetical protein